MNSQKRPFNHGCEAIEIACPSCGPLVVSINVVHSIWLRRRAEIESFILATHQQAKHAEGQADDSKHK